MTEQVVPAPRPIIQKKKKGQRINPAISEEHRERIQTTQIIKRLNAFILSENVERQVTDKKGNVHTVTVPDPRHYMAPHQVAAAALLLRKTVPDLSSVEHKGEVTTRHEVTVDYGPKLELLFSNAIRSLSRSATPVIESGPVVESSGTGQAET